MTDLDLAFVTLAAKKPEYDRLFAYADGMQPLKYSTARLQEAFHNLTAHFQQNWCAVVVGAALDRIALNGWDAGDDGLNEVLKGVWNANSLGLEAEQVHEAALITHESFVIAWPGEGGAVDVFYNDPRLCHVFYDPGNPRRKSFAAKWYQDGADDRWHLTLYYPDRMEYYVSDPVKGAVASATTFHEEMPPAFHGYGVIPVFHFRTNARASRGELDQVLTLQDAINKLLADMMVSAEFGAFKQRYIISNADTSALKNSPNAIWTIPPGDGEGQPVQVGEFQGTDLNLYLNAIDKLANSIAVITRTPKHYLWAAGSVPSGEALLAMEAPLTKKVLKLEAQFGQVWSELAAFILLLSGKGDVPPSEVKPVWEPVRSVQPVTEAQARKSAVDAGIPLNIVLQREGWTQDELAALEEAQATAKEEAATSATALLDKMRMMDANANPPQRPLPNKVVPPVNQGKPVNEGL